MVEATSTVSELVADLGDHEVELLGRLMARLALPSESAGAWSPQVEDVFHSFAAALDDERCRRRRVLEALNDEHGDGGVGELVDEGDGS